MNVVLLVGGEVIVDDQGNLLDINTTGQQVGGDQNTRGARAELLHDNLTLLLLHISVHGRDSELACSELLSQPVDLSASVAENNSLGNGDGLVEIAKSVKLPLLLLNRDIKLLDTLEGQFVLLDQDTNGFAHELGGDFHDLGGHGGGQKNDLGGLGKALEDIIDLVLETSGQHLIGLVEDEHLDLLSVEGTTIDHVKDTTGSTNNHIHSLLEFAHVVTDVGATNAGVAADLHEVTEGNDDLLDLLCQLTSRGKDQGLALLDTLIQLLKSRDREGSSLSSTRLSLSNDIMALDDRENGTLLNGRRTFETSLQKE